MCLALRLNISLVCVGRVWAGKLEHDYSFGIYFNRVAAANSPLEAGNRPNPRHTTSFQVILTAEGAIKMCVHSSHPPARDTALSVSNVSNSTCSLRRHYHEANASSHGRPNVEGRGVLVGWRPAVDSSASHFPGGQLVTAAAANLTHTVRLAEYADHSTRY
jgi:hypothetical protein